MEPYQKLLNFFKVEDKKGIEPVKPVEPCQGLLDFFKAGDKREVVTPVQPVVKNTPIYSPASARVGVAPLVLGSDPSGNDIVLDEKEREKLLYLLGVSGAGKSTMFLNLILQDIQDGAGVCVLDPHGDLTGDIVACVPEPRRKDIILLDLSNEMYAFGLNLYQCDDPTNKFAIQRAVERVMHIWDRLFHINRLTVQMVQFMRKCAETIIPNPGYTMAEIRLLFDDIPFRNKLLRNVNDIEVHRFWNTYDDDTKTNKMDDKSSILNKLDEFLLPTVRDIIGQPMSTINMRDIMDKGKILLVSLDRNQEGITSLVGSMIVALVRSAAFSRKNLALDERKPFFVYADEFDGFATLDFKSIMDECRKFKVYTRAAHQTRDVLHREVPGLVRSTLQGNLAVFIGVTAPDSEEIARNFDTTPPEPEIEIEEEPWGEEEIKTSVNDVVGWLLSNRGGHQDSIVNQFAVRTLSKLDADRQSKNSKIDTYLYQLNILLYEAMEYKQFNNSLSIETIIYFLKILEELYSKTMYPLLIGKYDEKLINLYSPWNYEAIIQAIDMIWEQEPQSFLWEKSVKYLDDVQRTYLHEIKLYKLKLEWGNIVQLYRPSKVILFRHWVENMSATVYKDLSGHGFASQQEEDAYFRQYNYLLQMTPQDDLVWVKESWCSLYPEETWYHVDFDVLELEYMSGLGISHYDNIFKQTPQEILDKPWTRLKPDQYTKFYDPADLDAAVEEELEEQKTIFLDFFSELKQVMYALAENGISQGSGQYRPIIRQIKRKPSQLSSAEMEARIANMLSGKRNYKAYVRVGGDENTVSVTPVQKDESVSVDAIIAEIVEKNVAAGYLRLRSDVEKEILERQQPPEPVQQETGAAEKPRQNKPAVVAAGAVAPPATRRREKIGD